jgi:hypothetical protein
MTLRLRAGTRGSRCRRYRRRRSRRPERPTECRRRRARWATRARPSIRPKSGRTHLGRWRRIPFPLAERHNTAHCSRVGRRRSGEASHRRPRPIPWSTHRKTLERRWPSWRNNPRRRLRRTRRGPLGRSRLLRFAQETRGRPGHACKPSDHRPPPLQLWCQRMSRGRAGTSPRSLARQFSCPPGDSRRCSGPGCASPGHADRSHLRPTSRPQGCGFRRRPYIRDQASSLAGSDVEPFSRSRLFGNAHQSFLTASLTLLTFGPAPVPS